MMIRFLLIFSTILCGINAIPASYVLQVEHECSTTADGESRVDILTDLNVVVRVGCRDRDMVVPSDDKVSYYISAFYEGDTESECIFMRRENSGVYILPVTIGWSEPQETERAETEKYMITCTLDPHAINKTRKHDTVPGLLGPWELQVRLGEESDSSFILEVTDIAGNPLHTHIDLGRKIQLRATMTPEGSEQGFRAVSCNALAGDYEYAVLRGGCGDGIVFPRTMGFKTTGLTLTSPFFEAFQLRESENLSFDCNFTACTVNCDGDSCEHENKRRRRRDVSFTGDERPDDDIQLSSHTLHVSGDQWGRHTPDGARTYPVSVRTYKSKPSDEKPKWASQGYRYSQETKGTVVAIGGGKDVKQEGDSDVEAPQNEINQTLGEIETPDTVPLMTTSGPNIVDSSEEVIISSKPLTEEVTSKQLTEATNKPLTEEVIITSKPLTEEVTSKPLTEDILITGESDKKVSVAGESLTTEGEVGTNEALITGEPVMTTQIENIITGEAENNPGKQLVVSDVTAKLQTEDFLSTIGPLPEQKEEIETTIEENITVGAETEKTMFVNENIPDKDLVVSDVTANLQTEGILSSVEPSSDELLSTEKPPKVETTNDLSPTDKMTTELHTEDFFIDDDTNKEVLVSTEITGGENVTRIRNSTEVADGELISEIIDEITGEPHISEIINQVIDGQQISDGQLISETNDQITGEPQISEIIDQITGETNGRVADGQQITEIHDQVTEETPITTETLIDDETEDTTEPDLEVEMADPALAPVQPNQRTHKYSPVNTIDKSLQETETKKGVDEVAETAQDPGPLSVYLLSECRGKGCGLQSNTILSDYNVLAVLLLIVQAVVVVSICTIVVMIYAGKPRLQVQASLKKV